jgi:hypothetical protein
MEVEELMRFARAYNKLGWAIQEQFDDIVDGNDYDDINPAALQEINKHLRGYNEDIDSALDAAMEALTTNT